MKYYATDTDTFVQTDGGNFWLVASEDWMDMPERISELPDDAIEVSADCCINLDLEGIY